MNKPVTRALAAVFLLVGQAAQGAFTNLDFESYSGSGSDLLPGWEENYAIHLLDMLPISSSGLGLVSTDGDFLLPLSGTYSGFLSSGNDGSPSFWQTDYVPASATHIQISTTYLNTDSVAFSYLLGGISLVESAPEFVGGHYVYTTDIHSLAGQLATLQFGVSYIGDPETPGGWHLVDDVSFLSIPEPGTGALLLLGAAWLARKKKTAARK